MHRCDVFVSHSWHDPPATKWRALRRWAGAFEAQHGRAPTLWLDKACINQQAITQSLACLPIWLSGCDKLLVLAGPTYCTRLWCVMECFVFLYAGGEMEHVVVMPLVEQPGTSADTSGSSAEPSAVHGPEEEHATFSGPFARFDASRCECFQPEDKEHLLATVEAAYGSLHAFSTAVRRRPSHTRRTRSPACIPCTAVCRSSCCTAP